MVDLTENHEVNLKFDVDYKSTTEGQTHLSVKKIIAGYLANNKNIFKKRSPSNYNTYDTGYGDSRCCATCTLSDIFASHTIKSVAVEKRYSKTKEHGAMIVDISVEKSYIYKPQNETVLIEITDSSKAKIKKMLRIIDGPFDYFEVYPDLISASCLLNGKSWIDIRCSGFFKNAKRISKLSFCAANYYIHSNLSTMWFNQKVTGTQGDSKRKELEKGNYVIQFCEETKEFILLLYDNLNIENIVDPSFRRWGKKRYYPGFNIKTKTDNYTWFYTEDFKNYWCGEFKEILQEVFLEAFRKHFLSLVRVKKNNKNYFQLFMRNHEVSKDCLFKEKVW